MHGLAAPDLSGVSGRNNLDLTWATRERRCCLLLLLVLVSCWCLVGVGGQLQSGY